MTELYNIICLTKEHRLHCNWLVVAPQIDESALNILWLQHIHVIAYSNTLKLCYMKYFLFYSLLSLNNKCVSFFSFLGPGKPRPFYLTPAPAKTWWNRGFLPGFTKLKEQLSNWSKMNTIWHFSYTNSWYFFK